MASFTTPPSLTDTQVLSAGDDGTVAAGSFVTVTTARAVQIDLAPAQPADNLFFIDNSGTISSTGTGSRAIDTTGTPTGVRAIQIVNQASGTITSQNDAVRINADLVTGSQIVLDNFGTISTTGTGNNGGQAIDFNAIATAGSTVLIVNRAGALISSADADAVRPGQGATVQNSGQITANAVAVPNDQPSADGIDFQNNKTGIVNNLATGIISGAKGGVAGGTNTDVTVTNELDGQIIGRNGAGVGLDGTGNVTNYGLIRGTLDTTSARGDGDGVDIDFSAFIINYGTIEGLGAKGNDSGGRANAGEGVSIGGGIIVNYGAIRSAATNPDGQTVNGGGAIIVNNDAMTNRSGVGNTTIANYVAGTITGGSTFAIRLENKGDAAISSDSITNYGSITGNGTVPDPNAIVTIPAGVSPGQPDPNSVGTLDGVAYTGTGSARFIRGDGSAIQMGEGGDLLENYGTITGNSGRAINLEGGNDRLILRTGSTVTGRIDGGSDMGGGDFDELRLALDDRTAALASTQGANSGVTVGTLANVTNFEILTVSSGRWTITDAQTYRVGAEVAIRASLVVGSTGALTSAVTTLGTLLVDGVLTGAVTVAADGSLGGSGNAPGIGLIAGSVDVSGTISAGATALSDIGTLNTGALTLSTANGATPVFRQDVTSTANADLINVTGAVTLAGTLDLHFAAAFATNRGDSFVFIDNDGTADLITTRFTDLAIDGAASVTIAANDTFDFNGRSYLIDYAADDGNDVAIRDVTPAPQPPSNPNPPTEPTQPTGPSADALMKFGMIATDTASQAGQVYGLYEALLNRAPDALGLESFTTALQNGASLTDVANTLLNSPERGMGAGDPTAFVQSLYQNLLNRPVDASGLATFTNELANGVSPATVAVQLATSAEAQSVLSSTFAKGVFVPDASEASVARLYYGLLERAPDAGGLSAYSAFIETSGGGAQGEAARLLQVASSILSSPEYAGTHGNLSDAAFVAELYHDALGRAPDGGQATYLSALANGTSRAQVAFDITQSPEAQIHLVGLIEQGALLVA